MSYSLSPFFLYPTSNVLVIMLVLPPEYIPDSDCFSPPTWPAPWCEPSSPLAWIQKPPNYPLLLFLVPTLYSQPNIQSRLFETKSEPHATA